MRRRAFNSSVAASLWEARWWRLRRRSRAAHRAAATVFALAALSAAGADWKIAAPGWTYQFPRDHHAHREFKTEWWYFTGNVFDNEGRRFGYELTFFRHGIRPLAERDPNASRFIVDDLKFAHFALTDVKGKRFQFEQKTSRGAFGEAGFDDGARIAWIEDWSLVAAANGWDIGAKGKNGEVRLHLKFGQGPVIHGENGVSVKAAGGASASHYYSLPRLETTGELRADGQTRFVQGETWFDHEWSSSQLGRGEIGWDWICLQWENGAALMLYRMRTESGTVEPSSSGTWIEPDGTATHLRASDFTMVPTAFWTSKTTKARYPIAWQIELPNQRLKFAVSSALDDQELKLGPITYWEGAIDADGIHDEKPIHGRGYLELTGYAGRLNEAIR